MQAGMELLAAIDVGTNTVRMLVAAREGLRLHPVLRMRRITGLGRELRETGAIGRRESGATLSALRAFHREMRRLGVSRFRACGTAALREASNRGEFLSAARGEGIPVEVITGREEARRTWQGIREKLGVRAAVAMDIGGGSTEFIAGGGAVRSVSLPIGVVVLCGAFPFSDPPAGWQIRNLRLYLAERIRAGTRRFGGGTVRRLIGTAGTFTTLAALDRRLRVYRPERIDGHRMAYRDVRRWEDRLTGMTDRERLALPGMEKGRERYIVPGVCQAAVAMERFGAEELIISDAGLLEGILRGIVGEKEHTG
ncbi:MAG: hypothetical protein M1377_03760 [Deltaproteobacteria bacterium]|nr:hypothetical protein [Deltaproteobacteria bacterium]